MSVENKKEESLRKILTYLRFAQRSGALSAGFDACVLECQKGQIHLIVITEDLSARTRRTLENKCGNRAKIIVFGLSADLGRETGLENKKILGVKNEHLAEAIAQYHEAYVNS